MATEYAEITDDVEDGAEEDENPLAVLTEFVDADNVAEMLDDTELGQIGSRVVREYELDKASRSEWEKATKDAMDLALQVSTTKSYPWPNAANVKYPLLTTASIQFAARAYPAIVAQGDVVKAKVIGNDEDGKKRDRGERIARHMSWQLTEEMQEWEEDTDKLLHILPIVGMCYRKTYFDPLLGRNRSEMVTADHCVVNDGVRDLETAPRITQVFELYPFEVEERMRSGIYRRVELGLPKESSGDEDAPHHFLEQHRKYDLDGDGYPEPYICVVHRDTSQVVRIVANFRMENVAINEDGEIARIERDQYFTKYSFLPNPSGSFHDIGLGYLLRPMNEAVNTTLNQMLDAGHLQNVGGGFMGSGARLRGGRVRMRIGEYVPVDVPGSTLRENMVHLDHRGPSPVLFQLLGLLIDAAKDISSVKDVMTGQEPKSGNTPATTTLALIDQGMQVFTAIYKRIFRSLKREYAKLYDLNGRYLDPETYFTVLDEPEEVGPDDYAPGDYDIVPVADPNVITNMQRMARAEFMMQFVDHPRINGHKVMTRLFEAAGIDGVDELILEEAQPDPEVLKNADEIEIKKRELFLREVELMSEIEERAAKALKAIAEAEAAEAGPQIAAYKGVLDALNQRAKIMADAQKEGGNVDRGGVSGVEGAAGNAGVPVLPAGGAGGPV